MWMPRGPGGAVVAIVLFALLLALIVAASALLLVGAVVAVVCLAAYQGARTALSSRRRAPIEEPVPHAGLLSRLWLGPSGLADRHRNEPPLQRYVGIVEEFDRLTTDALSLDSAGSVTWRGGRRVGRLLGRTAELRLQAITVERAVATDHIAEAARPGLWELIVAATELQHYLQAVLEFPSGRGRAAQTRELVALHERREDIDRRRTALIRRLQDTDLRVHPRASGG